MLLKEEILWTEPVKSNPCCTEWKALADCDVFDDLKENVSTNLFNLDVALHGGIAPEVYALVGRNFDERHALFIHLAEQFAQNDYHVIYLTCNDSPQSIMNKLLLRCDYKLYRNESSTVPFILQQLESSPEKQSLFLKQLYRISQKIIVETQPSINLLELEERISKLSEISKVVLLLDDQQFCPIELIDYEYYGNKLNSLREIAQRFKVPIISNVTLPKEEYWALKEGFPTKVGIENYADTIILFEKSQPANTPYVLNIKILSKTLYIKEQFVSLTYHPLHCYFQDA